MGDNRVVEAIKSCATRSAPRPNRAVLSIVVKRFAEKWLSRKRVEAVVRDALRIVMVEPYMNQPIGDHVVQTEALIFPVSSVASYLLVKKKDKIDKVRLKKKREAVEILTLLSSKPSDDEYGTAWKSIQHRRSRRYPWKESTSASRNESAEMRLPCKKPKNRLRSNQTLAMLNLTIMRLQRLRCFVLFFTISLRHPNAEPTGWKRTLSSTSKGPLRMFRSIRSDRRRICRRPNLTSSAVYLFCPFLKSSTRHTTVFEFMNECVCSCLVFSLKGRHRHNYQLVYHLRGRHRPG